MKVSTLFLIAPDGRPILVRELDDHVLELILDGQVIARFSQTGIIIDNILKEVQEYERNAKN